jgi:hypothetical protein
MADLETAVRERAHVLAIVFDNGRYGTIARHQEDRGNAVGLGTRLGAVDFAAIAEACGALGITVHNDDQFEPALARALAAGRPALIHLELDSRWTTPDATGMDLSAGEAIEAFENEGGAVDAPDADAEGVAADADVEGVAPDADVEGVAADADVEGVAADAEIADAVAEAGSAAEPAE